jgi:uncharacterized tellurite resistance protein B-like protein
MLQNINSFFDKYLRPGDLDASETLQQDQLQLASAALMIEICKADDSVDEEEISKITVILSEKFALNQLALDELFDLASQQTDEATSLYQFTSLIHEAYEYDAKIALIQNLWEVAYADGNLDRYEEHMIRKIADLLYISHSDFIRTKLVVKNS